MPWRARPAAKAVRPVLSETDRSARATRSGMRTAVPGGWAKSSCAKGGRPLADAVLGKLGAQRVAIHAEHVGSLRLVAAGALHDRRDERALDVHDDHVVNAVRGLAVEPPEILVERLLDRAAELVSPV